MRALAFLLSILLAATAGYWLLLPGHLRIDIPVAKHKGGGDFWWETHDTTVTYADEAGVKFVRRQVGTAYPDAQGWATVDEAMTYFSGWLTKAGWDVFGPAQDQPILPESRLLPREQARCFHRSGDRGPRADAVCVAIWPIASASVRGFHVVLTTARSSLLQKLLAD